MSGHHPAIVFATKDIVRFFSKIRRTETCWLWLAGTSMGYGAFWLNSAQNNIGAHVASWIIHYGPAHDLWILHHCDNPLCVNPIHLYAGTASDNSDDMVAKQRSRRWDRHPMSKLSVEDVLNIRSARLMGYRLVSLADRFGVTKENIHHIVKGKTWRGL